MTPRRHKGSPIRGRNVRQKKRTILIVGEGRETEPNYFHGLKREQSVMDHYALTIKKGNGRSRVQIVQEAVDKKKSCGQTFDEVWCVFDTESLASTDARQDYNDALQLARRNGIEVAVSNPSFEVWLLAHFVRSSRMFCNGNAVIAELNRHWLGKFARDYDKASARVYNDLANLTRTAIQNALAVRQTDHWGEPDIAKCNSSTDVYILVAKLLGNTGP